MEKIRKHTAPLVWVICLFALPLAAAGTARRTPPGDAEAANSELRVVSRGDGSYSVYGRGEEKAVLRARVGAQVEHKWLRSTDYPRHETAVTSFADELGEGQQLTVTHAGLSGQPDLVCIFRLHGQPALADLEVQVRNSGEKVVTVQAIRLLEAVGERMVDLGGPDAADRVLSDSFSEDRPSMEVRDLAQAAKGLHRAVGSQLVYNRESKRSLFLGALTSQRWLTVVRLKVTASEGVKITAYEVDSAGTTELARENSLREAPPEDQIELSLPLAPGESLASERLLLSTGSDYHGQLGTYGAAVRQLHKARVSAPAPMGWWSWTAYYFGLNQDTAATNARWLAEHLKKLGYSFFHIDEGYQYARGEYTTPNATLFPDGVKPLGEKVRGLGLAFGIWTAPFEVSERSWIYETHKDWLVHNASGKPIHAGFVTNRKDALYVLDTTHPGAREYLRQTYATLVRDWGVRYIKLDFMEDTAIEGYYYRPNVTALEAQRIGLRIIREAVGEQVLLDKDGSPMLNPVGIVDAGRTSVDTGHTFEASKEAAPGIAARYYMNRNFFINDPDAFTVSRQTVSEQEWHGGKRPLTLEEAKVSIALAAISGGMYEIGDDLPALGADADRLALVENHDLINMARLGRAATPLDLMSYTPDDAMPSVFLLQEDQRQAILTVFNWTEQTREHRFTLAGLGLRVQGHNQILDIFEAGKPVSENAEVLTVSQPAHSVRMFKIVDTATPAAAPAVTAEAPPSAEVAVPLHFAAQAGARGVPALSYRWEFGDGTSAEGPAVSHAYTRAGDYAVRLVVEGMDAVPAEQSFAVTVKGVTDTRFDPSRNSRFSEKK